MTDYQLSGLSPRTFEHLVQALASRVVGSSVTAFGDGPDGGREATFVGTTSYPSPSTPWAGYGVIQAKFRQRPLGQPDDGKWALSQLSAELAAYVHPDSERRKPEYYIFATNVVLTPVPDSGSKDRAWNLLEEHRDALGLKGFAVWDYDQLRILLDNAAEIRQAYAAWITSGDVLSRIMEWLDVEEDRFPELVALFLQRELLADQYVNLEQAGYAGEEKIPLAQVFVDLPVSADEVPDQGDSERGAGFIARVLDIADEKLSAGGRLEESERSPGRLVLVGGPGQGKSTLGQFLCQLFRAALLAKRPSGTISPEAHQALDDIREHIADEDLRIPGARRFPIRVVLSHFAAALASPDQPHVNSILSYIAERMTWRVNSPVKVDDLRVFLRSFPWLVVLDGLDEVPASSNRTDVLAAVKEFWIDAAASEADVLLVATTRPQGYNDDFAPRYYQHSWLAPLSLGRAMHYATRLAERRFASDTDRREKVVSRLDLAASHEATRRLMRTPLQVTIMTILVDRMGHAPQERWRLFNEYYNVIYQREIERDTPAAATLRDHRPDVDAVHRIVGLVLQIESENAGGTDAHLSVARFEAIVKSHLEEEGYRGDELTELADALIEAATQRLVFLVGLRENAIGFEIRSLQEYVAAEALSEGGDELVQDRLAAIAPVVSWRNVFLLAAGKCFAVRQHLRDSVHTVCAALNDSPDDRLSRITLAGSELALDLLRDGPARRQPKYGRLLARLALRLLDRPAAPVHVQLARIYDPSFEDIYREEIQTRLDQARAPKLATWLCVERLIEAGVAWAREMGASRWPSGKTDEIRLLRILVRGRKGWLSENLLPRVVSWDLDLVRTELGSFDLGYRGQPSGERPIEEWEDLALEFMSPRRYVRGTEIDIRLKREEFRGDSPLRLRLITSLENNGLIRSAAVATFPKSHESWWPHIAGARFEVQPSVEILAEGLASVSMARERGVPSGYISSGWQLYSIVRAFPDALHLQKAAQDVRDGRFGTETEWRAAEERLRATGVTRDDILHMTDTRWPFDESIGEAGYPLATGWWIVMSGGQAHGQLQQLADLYGELCQSNEHFAARKAVAELIVVLATHAGHDGDIGGRGLGLDLDTLAADLAEEPYSLLLLGLAAQREPSLRPVIVDALDAAGRELDSIYDRIGSIEPIVEAYKRDRTREGLLRLILESRPSTPLKELEISGNTAFEEKNIATRCAVLKAATQQGDNSLSGSDLWRLISDIALEDRSRGQELVHSWQQSSHISLEFIEAVEERLPDRDDPFAGSVYGLLSQLLTERLSGLGDPTRLIELGFPEAVRDAVGYPGT